MRISFEFEVDGFELHATELARLLLDIQHLVVVSVALTQDQFEADDIVFDVYMRTYKWMIEARGDDLGEADLIVTRLKMESPLSIEVWLKNLSQKSKESFVQVFRYLLNHFLFVDLERERRSVEIQRMREEVLEKRIQNAVAALNLAKKIPNQQLRNELIDSLTSSVMPFEAEHPPIKSVNLIRDADDTQST